jgi:preprotein translocase subunit SecF
MRLFQNANFKFIEKRRTAYMFSAALILAGVVGMVVNLGAIGSWVNYGIDFTGGSLVQVRFQQPATVSDLRSALEGSATMEISRFGEEALSEFVIRAPIEEGMSITEVAQDIEAQISARLPGRSFEVVRTELVGAKVGSELQQRAASAVLLSLVLTLIYLAFRFELRFGLAAVIATAHDILITLGIVALMRLEVGLPTVAAILTVLGYSLNDTIIVFDRIRENLNMKGARKRDLTELVNQSINETLPRTVLTSGTTLVVLFALLALGGPVIRDFTIVLILGILFGTYSSIFVASPALIEIQKRWGMGKLAEGKKKKPEPATV